MHPTRFSHPTTAPLLGIITTTDERGQLRGNLQTFQALTETGARLKQDVVVLDWSDAMRFLHRTTKSRSENAQVAVWAYHLQKRKWEKRACDFPSVLYNRISSRNVESAPEAWQALRNWQQFAETPLFNPFFLNKWQLHMWMKYAKIPRLFIPHTARFLNAEDGIQMMQRFPELLLKPIHGKAGIGIARVRKLGPMGSIEWQTEHQVEKHAFDCASRQDWDALLNRINGQAYLLQQAIPLAKFNQRPFDLRVLIQKNRSGSWYLTGLGIRLAGSSALTTHVPRGGQIADPQEVLQRTFPRTTIKEWQKRVQDVARQIAKRIERHAGGTWGEFSMDLGICKDQNIWFFEANAKPMKFDEPTIRRKSLERIIEFAQYLKQNCEREQPKTFF